jgi:hypothetical protein
MLYTAALCVLCVRVCVCSCGPSHAGHPGGRPADAEHPTSGMNLAVLSAVRVWPRPPSFLYCELTLPTCAVQAKPRASPLQVWVAANVLAQIAANKGEIIRSLSPFCGSDSLLYSCIQPLCDCCAE